MANYQISKKLPKLLVQVPLVLLLISAFLVLQFKYILGRELGEIIFHNQPQIITEVENVVQNTEQRIRISRWRPVGAKYAYTYTLSLLKSNGSNSTFVTNYFSEAPVKVGETLHIVETKNGNSFIRELYFVPSANETIFPIIFSVLFTIWLFFALIMKEIFPESFKR